tara:strand:- start:5125 stop:5580 length:456 start_codon:yes stop_codon:yes gene_type:complete
MRAVQQVISWTLTLFLIAVFLHWTVHPWPGPQAGAVIFYDLPGENLVFSTLAQNSGFAFFEPTLRTAFGAALLVSAILLLIPRFRRFGAWFAAACFALLCAAHLSPWLGIEIPAVTDGSRTDAGAHFYLSGSGLVASLLLAFLHPRQIDLS